MKDTTKTTPIKNIEGALCTAKTDSWTDKTGKKLISRKRGRWKKPKQ